MAHGVKTISREKFLEAYNGFLFGGLTLKEASKVAGISIPTLRKYFEIEYTGGEFPDTLFNSREERGKEFYGRFENIY